MDYDPIDFAVGTYRDVVQTGLLSVEEYASSTNESVAGVKRRIENAVMILEFLEYLRLPEKYHVAREYQVYSLCQEMAAPLKQLNEDEKKQLKQINENNQFDANKHISFYLPTFATNEKITNKLEIFN